jgi:ABC-2 type transport system ATP-binding protein
MSNPTGGAPIVVGKGLTRKFGAKRAIDELDLQLDAGVLVGLVGPNGAGKTTLLNLLLGLIEPTAGRVDVLGHPARALPAKIACRVVGVGDRHEPPPWVCLIDVVRLQAEASPHFDDAFAQRLLMDRRFAMAAQFGSFSKGQRRWALAVCAIASCPALLLLDEPADGLDPEARRELYDHLRTLVNQHGTTVIVASHIMADLERVADDVVILLDGRVRLHDSFEALRDEVREVEIPAGTPHPAWLDGCDVLAEFTDAAGRRLWVRQVGDAETALPDHGSTGLSVRRANLESLYLAVTRRSAGAATAFTEKEPALCP